MFADPHLLSILAPAVAVCSTVILLGPPVQARRARALLVLLLGRDLGQPAAAD